MKLWPAQEHQLVIGGGKMALQIPFFYASQAVQSGGAQAAQEQICQVCARFSPVVEPVLPHLVLADLSGCRRKAVEELIAEVSAAAGSPACAGVASSRWVARCAATSLVHQAVMTHRPKPANTLAPSPDQPWLQSKGEQFWFEIPPGKEAAFLAPFSVQYLLESDLPKASELVEHLLRLGVSTLGELAAISPGDLTGQFGTKAGPLLRHLAMGKDPTPIRPLYPPDQAAAFFRSSENDPGLISTGAVDQVLIHLSSQLAATLAARGRAARTIRLEVTTRKGKQYGARQLRQAASRRDTILAAARRLWEAALATEPVLGIGLYSENLETPPVQQGKILNHDSLVIDGLNRAMHSVHSRFGATALQTAGQLPLTRRELIRTMWEKENL